MGHRRGAFADDARRRWGNRARALGFVALVLGPLAVDEAAAKDCGGAIACACGDRVVASTTLADDLNNCLGDGLILAAGILDCAGRQIAGPGDRTGSIGIALSGPGGQGATGAQIRNCRVRNFGRGVEIRGGTGNVLAGNVLFDNEVGIWIAAASSGNRIEDNYVHDNRDEGIHIGSGARLNTVEANLFVNNRAENVYLLGASANIVRDNTLDGAKAAAIFLKNSSGNVIEDNEILDRSVLLRGDSDGNLFLDNDLTSGAFVFSAIEDASGWRHPNGNTVVGGQIAKASTCFELVGAYENSASDVVVDTCATMQEKPAGGLVPFGNQIAVTRMDLDDAASGQRRTGSLRRAGADGVPDRYKIDLRNLPIAGAVDLAGIAVGCELRNADGTVLAANLPAGALEAAGDGARFIDRTGTADGVTRLHLRRSGSGSWRIRIAGRMALGEVRVPLMTLDCHIGEHQVTFTDLWRVQPRGWRLRVQP